VLLTSRYEAKRPSSYEGVALYVLDAQLRSENVPDRINYSGAGEIFRGP